MLTWYGEGYWNLPNSTGATVIAEGAAGSLTFEGDEYTKHEPASGDNRVFYNGTSSNTALGDAVLIYNGEFR